MWQVSDELKADREFILAAVAQDGDTLKHASAELKADREVVLAAARQNPGALRHATAALRDGLPIDMWVLPLQRLALAGVPPQRSFRLKFDACRRC